MLTDWDKQGEGEPRLFIISVNAVVLELIARGHVGQACPNPPVSQFGESMARLQIEVFLKRNRHLVQSAHWYSVHAK